MDSEKVNKNLKAREYTNEVIEEMNDRALEQFQVFVGWCFFTFCKNLIVSCSFVYWLVSWGREFVPHIGHVYLAGESLEFVLMAFVFLFLMDIAGLFMYIRFSVIPTSLTTMIHIVKIASNLTAKRRV